MTRKKKRNKPRRRSPSKSKALALRDENVQPPVQPPPAVVDATGAYVKVPLPPELVATAQEIAGLFFRADDAVRALLGAVDRGAELLKGSRRRRTR